jgi:hypothetical protein
MNILAAFNEFVVAARLPKDHITMRIAKNYSVPLSVAQNRWAAAKQIVRRQKKEGDFFLVLTIVDKMRNDPLRPNQSSPLAIPRRPLKTLRKPSSMPLQKRRNTLYQKEPTVASVDVFRRPKKRHLLMDLEHIRQRLKRKYHHPTSTQKMRRKLARKLWQRRNKLDLERRKQFLKNYWAVHGHH